MQPDASSAGRVAVELPWWRRWRALLMGSFLLIAALVVAAEALHVRAAQERAEADALASQAEAAAALVRATEQLVGRYQALALATAEAVFRGGIAGEARRRFLSDLAAAYPEVPGLYVIDPRGRVVGASRPEAVGLDLSGRPDVQRVLAAERSTVGDLVADGLTAGPHVAVLAAVRAPGGGLLGAVAIPLPAALIGRALGPTLGGGAEVLVVDGIGRVVFQGGVPDLDWAARDFSSLPIVATALAGGAAETRQFVCPVTGRRLLGAMAPVPETGWAVGAVRPAEAVRAGVRREVRASGIAVTAVALAGLALAVLLSRWLAEPVAALAAGAVAWSRGDLAHRISPRWRNEFGCLARHFNAMAAALETARGQEQALAGRLGEANAALERRVAELSTLFDVIPIGIAIAHDPACRAITGNPAFEQMLGMPRGTNLSKSAPPGERPPFRLYQGSRELTAEELPMQVAAARGERVSGVEIDVLWPDGTRRKLLEWAAPLFDAGGLVRGSVLAVVDMTEREAAEQALRFLTGAGEVLAASLEIESTLGNVARLMVPALGDWCVVDLVDGDGRIRAAAAVHADPAAEPALRRLVARPLDLDAGRPVTRAILTGEPQLMAEVPAGWAETLPAPPDERAHLAALGPRSLLSVPLGARGRVLGAVTVARSAGDRPFGEADVALLSELGRRAALAIDNARLYREARDATAARDAFLARASHELRTPLTSALGSVRLLGRSLSGALREPPDRLVEMANRNLDAMLSLVNDLLDASRLAVTQARLETASVDVTGLVGGSMELVEPQARERGIAVESAVPAGLRVPGDAEKLERVLVNLLANAVRHTAQGGTVTVEAEADQDEVVLRVRDRGDGIAPEDLERIFEPFVRVLRPGRRDRGTGLGLAICRQIVALHGGRIWAESAGEGEGSLFVVRLPARPRAPDAA